MTSSSKPATLESNWPHWFGTNLPSLWLLQLPALAVNVVDLVVRVANFQNDIIEKLCSIATGVLFPPFALAATYLFVVKNLTVKEAFRLACTRWRVLAVTSAISGLLLLGFIYALNIIGAIVVGPIILALYLYVPMVCVDKNWTAFGTLYEATRISRSRFFQTLGVAFSIWALTLFEIWLVEAGKETFLVGDNVLFGQLSVFGVEAGLTMGLGPFIAVGLSVLYRNISLKGA